MMYMKLNNNILMPCLGLGTFPMNGDSLVQTIKYATQIGYCSFDTATAYKNEEFFGHAIQVSMDSGIKREDLFITTKVSNKWQRDGDIRRTFHSSLERLHLDYLDLYLIHWPNPRTFIDTWKKMEELYTEGKVRAIGVSNFHEHHLEQLLKHAQIIPAVNQVELHPLLSQRKLANYCEALGIKMVAYSPLARMDKKLIQHEVLREIAFRHQKTVPQIILRWNLDLGYAVIPKTENPERLKENFGIFEFQLSEEEIHAINNINEDYRVRHNPDTCDYSKL